MTCGEARQYIFAFLDNELDSALSLDVQQHIEHCPYCARECEIENTVRRQLAARLQSVDNMPAFDESTILGMLRYGEPAPPHAHRESRRFWMVGAASGIAAAIILTLALFVGNEPAPTEHGSLANALVDDFDHFVTASKPLGIVSSDADQVSRWLQEQTTLVVRMPAVDSSIAELQGGRKCKIGGKPAAFAVYRVGNELASVVAMHEAEESLAHLRRIERDGHTHWVDRCRGHTVLVCRRGELIYAVVSLLPEESLSLLMPPAEG